MKCRYTAKRGWKIIAMMICLLCWASTLCGQSTKEKLKRVHVKVDSVLTTRYNKVKYDTNYVGRPPQKLTLKIRPNLSGSNITMRGDVAGVYTKTELGTAYRGTVSLCVSYIGISAAVSINPGSLSGKNKDVEMNANDYTRIMRSERPTPELKAAAVRILEDWKNYPDSAKISEMDSVLAEGRQKLEKYAEAQLPPM